MITKKLLFVVVGILIGLIFLNTASYIGCAENGNYNIYIEKTSYKYLKTETHGGHDFVYYDITILLYNSGHDTSDEIIVKLRDEDGNYTRIVTVDPGEYKAVVFNDHIFWGNYKRTLSVEFYPVDLDQRTSENSGDTTITIKPHKDGVSATSTPGFELIILIAGIFVGFLINKNRKT